MNYKTKSFMTKKKAFTLIELLIVIAIIGILFIVLVSKVDFATDKAKATGVQTDFRSFQLAFEQVAKENAGFNTFGWDTGDTNGDRIRNSYDEGDTNKDGVQDLGETWTGRKQYTETWTGVYTLVKPGTTGYDADVIAALETAINANLDPKLHITISTDGVIAMANGAQDPWKNEYHGRYLSNAGTDKLDRGVILMYSDGANGVNGSADGIAGGLVNITTPGSNKDGKDDYALATVYTYANGYGEVKSITYGFSNNQSFGDASAVPVTPVGQAPSVVLPTPDTPDTPNTPDTPDTPDEPIDPQPDEGATLPTPNLEGTVANSVSPIAYEWSELKALAQANLSADELRNTYGIEVGDYKEVDSVKYVLVDLGLDEGDYDGFVFMYNSGTKLQINSISTSSGGYAASAVAPQVEALYTNLSDSLLKSAIKEVTLTCNDSYYDNDLTHEYTAHMFLASYKEVGFTSNLTGKYATGYNAEGTCFDLFTSEDSSRKGFANTANISSYWWLRSTYAGGVSNFHCVVNGFDTQNAANYSYIIVPVFVIG